MYRPSDYDNGNGGGANLLPVGKHIVQITDHEIGFTTGGHKQVIITFEREDGAKRKGFFICSGDAGWQFGSVLTACEWPPTEELDEDDTTMMRDAIYERDVEIVVRAESYQGKESLKVKYVNKAKGGTGQPERTARTPGERFGGASLPESEVNPPPPGDDDIPFSGRSGGSSSRSEARKRETWNQYAGETDGKGNFADDSYYEEP